ncbi:SH3 domain-containing protein [Streptomyces sp. NPDC005202]|uniref:SH3 domain-containing protein n=1 Tax=Streptomyces sp. NPDC005202 TaxID=3157021 RepID=UPI0033BF1C39
MPLRSSLSRLAVAAAAGALVAAATVTPAVADDDQGDDPGTGRPDESGQRADGPGVRGDVRDNRGDDDPRFFRGRSAARGGLALHTRPDRGSRVIRHAREGEIVWIYCKTAGENAQGNRIWYLPADGAWAWEAARYIDNVGPAPRWCRPSRQTRRLF